MSANNIIIKSAFAVVATAGLTLTAFAGNSGSRYGAPSVYDYESGGNCHSAPCVKPVQQNHRYGGQTQTYQQPAMQVSPGVVYVDCTAMGTCAPQPTYQAAPQQYTTQQYTTQSYSAPAISAPTAECPAGTTPQSDGTCMQSSYSSTTSYSSTPSYSSSTSYSSAPSYSGEMVACPSGTTKQSDGTCMQTGSSYSSSTSYSSTPSYSSSTSYSTTTSAPANCPAGTTAQSDGTCMQSGSSAFTGGTATIYAGDATTTSSTYGGYTSDGSYTANDYLPIRK